jgi:ABC-type glycerol-3-phosphate transport system substrate-binding protein
MEQTIVAGKMAPSSYGTFIPPTDQTPLRFSGFTEGLFITSESSKADAAGELLNFFTSVSSQQLDQNAYTDVLGVPAIPGYVGTAQWAKWLAQYPHYVIQDQSLSTNLANAYFNIQSNVVQGSQSPKDAAAAMQQAAQSSQSGT